MSNNLKNTSALQRQFQGFLESPLLFSSYEDGVVTGFQMHDRNPPGDWTFLEELEISNLTLGKRVERFFSAWIQRGRDYDVLLENIQIQLEKKTLGELDFILKDKAKGQLHHIELVYKFYLYDPSANGPEINRWIGPNRKDTLALKLEKLKKHQFPLLHQQETISYLEKLNLDHDQIAQELCFFGCLFLPLGGNIPEMSGLNKTSIQGSWLRRDQLKNPKYREAQFVIPAKEDWLTSPLYGEYWLNYNEAVSVIDRHLASERSPLVWMKRAEEYFRFFVVWW